MCAVDVLSLGTLNTVTVVGVFAGLTVCAADVLGMTRDCFFCFLNDHFRHNRHLKDFPDNNNEDSEYN